MGPDEQPTSRPGKGLDRDVVVGAALALIDRDGAQSLTMRGLGAVLDVEAMSLYRYVSGREDLLEAVVTAVLSEVRGRLDLQLARSWQGYLQTLAHEFRRVAVEHPRVFPLIATRHPAAPWLRPPLRSLELVEDLLARMTGYGFTDEQAVWIYRAYSSLLLGHLLLESTVRGAQTSPVEQPLDEGSAGISQRDGVQDLSESPSIARMQPMLSEDRGSEEFDTALETLLDRLEMTISQ